VLKRKCRNQFEKEITQMAVKLVIVGGVAGGATAAARARRLDEGAEIIVFERGEHISFANCGLPYYIGQVIKKRDRLLVTTAEALRTRYNIDVRNFSEVTAIDRNNKHVTVKNLQNGEIYTETYDKLILSPGAEPIKPRMEGIELDTVFSVRNIPDTDRIKAYIDNHTPESAVIVGGGYIGLEMAENLVERGVKTTIIEMLDQVMAPLDYEMAAMVQDYIKTKGVVLELENSATAFTRKGNRTVVSTGRGIEIECDLVILSIGIKPETQLARTANLAIGERGGIKVNAGMQTSDPDIFAVGDAVEIKELVTGAPAIIALAGPANKQGRIAADNAMGRQSVYNGAQATAIVKVFDMTAASTGASEKILKKNKISYLSSYTHSDSHAGYYPGAERLSIKLLFSPDNGALLGAQAVGKEGVDKRIDVLATALRANMTVYDLEELELAYAPPYSSAKDPVNMAGFVAANILKQDLENTHWHELDALDSDECVLVDLRTKKELEKIGIIDGAVNIPVDELRQNIDKLDKEKTYVLCCAVGQRAYIGHRILKQKGFQSSNLSGGYVTYASASVKEKINPGN
jgi:NADPH-dependent 2,4-dienoyl-CoA reductase/sulfur reductase-like enzyme/rhodanese-related sulfurtransferase